MWGQTFEVLNNLAPLCSHHTTSPENPAMFICAFMWLWIFKLFLHFLHKYAQIKNKQLTEEKKKAELRVENGTRHCRFDFRGFLDKDLLKY